MTMPLDAANDGAKVCHGGGGMTSLRAA